MAKLINPLFSETARGALARKIIFNGAGKTATAKRWHKPSGRPSLKQIARRNEYAAAKDTWNLLSVQDKAQWAAIGGKSGITGFNAYMAWSLGNKPPIPCTEWDNGATVWDGGATVWDVAKQTQWDNGATVWDGGATLWLDIL